MAAGNDPANSLFFLCYCCMSLKESHIEGHRVSSFQAFQSVITLAARDDKPLLDNIGFALNLVYPLSFQDMSQVIDHEQTYL